jgi:hypothetical protein
MQIPYTTSTGIKMGSRYLERNKVAPIDDPDMLFLQEALLATPNYVSTRRLHNIVMSISFFTLIGVVLFVYLLN